MLRASNAHVTRTLHVTSYATLSDQGARKLAADEKRNTAQSGSVLNRFAKVPVPGTAGTALTWRLFFLVMLHPTVVSRSFMVVFL